jgi:hypothetical protein
MNSDILMQGNARDEMQLADRTRDGGSEAGYRKSKNGKFEINDVSLETRWVRRWLRLARCAP